MVKKSKRGQAGFSLVEAMVAAVILGIGLLGLVELHRTSIRGTVKAISAGQALEIGRQVAETILSADYVSQPNPAPAVPNNCAGGAFWPAPGPSLPPPGFGVAGVLGCRQDANSFSATKNGLCTFYAEEAPVNTGNGTSPFEPATVNTQANGRFRIDTAIHGHPNPLQYPDSVMATVWVCWRDSARQVHEVRTTRILTQDL